MDTVAPNTAISTMLDAKMTVINVMTFAYTIYTLTLEIMMTRYMDGVCPNLKCLDSECSTIEDRRTTPTFRSSIDAKSKEAKVHRKETSQNLIAIIATYNL